MKHASRNGFSGFVGKHMFNLGEKAGLFFGFVFQGTTSPS